MKRQARFSRWICLVLVLAMAFTSGFAFTSSKGGGSEKSPFSDVRKGDIVSFGSFEQDDLTRNGAEPIEWIVLAVEGDQALLLSRYCLTCMSFNSTGRGGAAWEDSDLREWLNEEFYEDAFSDAEKDWIFLTDVSNGRADYGAHKNDTQDRLFVLSAVEVRDYLTSKKLCAAEPTEYALAEGIQQNKNNKCSWWWLRTNGKDKDRIIVMFSSGSLSSEGSHKHVTDKVGGVRPAMWVSIDGKA